MRANSISKSGLSIYDQIEAHDSCLWFTDEELELLLRDRLCGRSYTGLPLRTRSKAVKTDICEALGYPVPTTFTKTQPRFPGQCFDAYIQKSNNLQIWNEDIEQNRRYVIIRLSATDVVERVRVVKGDTLASLDTTGTLTQKYQARLTTGGDIAELVSPTDTYVLLPIVSVGCIRKITESGRMPTDMPENGLLLPIADIYSALRPLLGKDIEDTGSDQERSRGGELHSLVCKTLGYATYADDGRFPDIRHQLLEIKLQTSPTIDLGLYRPDSTELLFDPTIGSLEIRHCDIRYALFFGQINSGYVTLTNLYLVTGEDFFTRFPHFRGRVINRKLQIPLPDSFFSQ